VTGNALAEVGRLERILLKHPRDAFVSAGEPVSRAAQVRIERVRLAWGRAHPRVLGVPTTVDVPAGGERTLCYGTALVRLDPALVREGVHAVEAEPGALVLRGERAAQRVPVAADFEAVRRVVARLG
jgi:hypothetical protein